MDLVRVHAYAVVPRRVSAENPEPYGGAVVASADLKAALERAAEPIQQFGIQIDLRFDQNRASVVRDLIVSVAFGTPAEAKSAAVSLATRLGNAMDERSNDCLLVAAVYNEHPARNLRQVRLWTFPKDEAFQFRGAKQPKLNLLRDIFSRTSRLQKGAILRGTSGRSGFTNGVVLDFQANSQIRPVADFWIQRFLDATLSIQSATATRMAAAVLKKAYETAEDSDYKDALYRLATSVQAAQRTRWSLRDMANEYLSEEFRPRLLRLAPNEASRTGTFDVDKTAFEHALNLRVFDLKSGAVLSAPFQTIGDVVKVSEDGKRLSMEDAIVRDRIGGKRRPLQS